MSAGNRTKLPERDVMLQQLKKVTAIDTITTKFYPLILKHAGEYTTGVGICMILALGHQRLWQKGRHAANDRRAQGDAAEVYLCDY
jgi:hypothetical protein